VAYADLEELKISFQIRLSQTIFIEKQMKN